MPRTLAINKHVDLSSISEGWEGCFAKVSPADYEEISQFANISSLSTEEKIKLTVDLATKHFVRGKVLVEKEDGTTELADMVKDDVRASTEITDLIFAAIAGVTPDPKDISTSTAKSSTDKPSSEPSTTENDGKTPSSMEQAIS